MWVRQCVRFFSVCNSRKPSRGPQSPKTGLNKNWENAFGKHLLFTNTWTSGVLMAAGDLLEQELEYQRNVISKRYDWSRVGRMFITGLGLGPIHHYFYGWMNKKLPYRTMPVITGKIFLDQIIMSPCCICFLFISTCLMEGKSLSECSNELQRKFMKIYLVDWCVWPAAQFFNFYYLAPRYQVLYINGVTMIYNIFLSYIKHEHAAIKNVLEEKSVIK